MLRNIMKERPYTMKKGAEQDSRDTLQTWLDLNRSRVSSMGRALGMSIFNNGLYSSPKPDGLEWIIMGHK